MDNTTFLWHDYETFGANPRIDRPCQFAALRTDAALEPIGESITLYCKPSIDTLPHPKACWITGITPQYAHTHGLIEPEFAKAVYEVMAEPGSCAVGYNNLRFDDEVSRHLFWRNFIDPYAREYANGNSRFDLINVLRLTRALRPEGIQWADYDDGQPSFRLEDLAKANGLDITRAHDAMADVENTLAMARLVRNQQPKLWDWALGLRNKQTVDGLLSKREPLVYASAYFAQRPGSVAVIWPLARHPKISNQWLVWDLGFDPRAVFEPNGQPVAESALVELPLPVSSVKINACPMLAPLSVVDADTQHRLGLDLDALITHQQWLVDHPEWIHAAVTAQQQRPSPFEQEMDPEVDLYGGFVPRQDQALVRRIPALSPQDLADLQAPFQDPRLNVLLFRYRARHWPESLDESEAAQWQADRHARLIEGREGMGLTLDEYALEVESLAHEHPEASELITALRAWPKALEIDARSAT